MKKFLPTFTVDWLEFTWKPTDEVIDKMHEVGIDLVSLFFHTFPEIKHLTETVQDGFTLLTGANGPKGRNGYTYVFSMADDFFVMSNPDRLDMGIHVQFPGHGMHLLPKIFGLPVNDEYAAASELFRILIERGSKFTRIDLAFDDFQKVYTPYDYLQFKLADRIKSKCKSWSYIASAGKFGGTFYLGNRSNGRFLRIYDKDYESEGAIPSVRYELELKSDYANAAAAWMADQSSGDYFCDILKDMMVLIEPVSSSTESGLYAAKCRAAVDEKFEDLFKSQVYRKVPFKVEAVKREFSLSRQVKWFEKQLRTSLHIFLRVIGPEAFLCQVQDVQLTEEKERLLRKYTAEFEEMRRSVYKSA